MVWGSISGNGVGKFVKIDSIVNIKIYHSILVGHGIPSGLKLIGREFIYQQHSDPKHTSQLCREYLTKEKESGVLELMDQTNQSPDLNPIEQIWDLVDLKIDCIKVSSTASLWEQLETIWSSVTKETVETYIKTMPVTMQGQRRPYKLLRFSVCLVIIGE